MKSIRFQYQVSEAHSQTENIKKLLIKPYGYKDMTR